MYPGLLEEGEVVYRVFRRSAMKTFTKILTIGVLGVGLGAGIMWFFYPYNVLWYLAFLPWGAAGYFALWLYMYWALNAIIMTSENVIFIDWEKFFCRRTTRLDYWNIDDISVERIGLKSFFYNYGTIHFQKVNGGELYSFHKMNRPNAVARQIEAMREEVVDNKNFTEEAALKGLISGLIKRHVEDEQDPDRLDPDGEFEEEDDEDEVFERELGVLSSKASKQLQKPKKSEKTPPKKPLLTRMQRDEMPIEIEKELDDEGGIEIDLES